MTDETKTPEQLAAEAKAAAEQKAAADAAAKAQAKADKDARKAADKQAADEVKAKAKAEKEQAKLDAKAKKEADAKAKADAKAQSEAAKESTKQPMQNEVRRPKPDGACGKVWAFADQLSAQMGQPVPIANLQATASAAGINDSTIRTQYALWRKFNGVVGRVVAPVAPAASTPAADGAQAAAQ